MARQVYFTVVLTDARTVSAYAEDMMDMGDELYEMVTEGMLARSGRLTKDSPVFYRVDGSPAMQQSTVGKLVGRYEARVLDSLFGAKGA